jgi:hypothetical protein
MRGVALFFASKKHSILFTKYKASKMHCRNFPKKVYIPKKIALQNA